MAEGMIIKRGLISLASPNSDFVNDIVVASWQRPFLGISSMAASGSTHCNAPLPNVSILEVMPGNQQQDHLNKQLAILNLALAQE